MLAQLDTLAEAVDPVYDLAAYIKAVKKKRYNGVNQPFWRDWPLADPVKFLSLEPLHHLHKMFWDHDLKWCICIVGENEIDFRFSVLHPHTGFWSFTGGVSKMKETTGQDHRNIQQYIMGIIAGAVGEVWRDLSGVRGMDVKVEWSGMDSCGLSTQG